MYAEEEFQLRWFKQKFHHENVHFSCSSEVVSRNCNIGPKCLKEPAASLSLLTASFPADGTHPEDQSNEPKDVPQDAECAFEPGVGP